MSDTSGISHVTERKRLLDLAAAYDAIGAERDAATGPIENRRREEAAVLRREAAAAMEKVYAKYREEIDNIAAPFEVRQRAVEDEIEKIENDVALGVWRYDGDREERAVCIKTGLPIFEDDDADEVEGLVLIGEAAP